MTKGLFMTFFSKINLGDFDGNRRNNFTLIRIIFAWLVLYGHSYAVQKVAGISDPLGYLFQGSLWVGELAVNGFFTISGFLVSASLINRNVVDYSISRFLRVFPALFVCVFASVFVLGPWMSTLAIGEYFSKSETFAYLTNSLAFFKMCWMLPGVFESNGMSAINGSLWTLTVEVRCYVLLALTGFLGLLKNRVISNITVLAVFLFGYSCFSEFPLLGENAKYARPSLYFLIGVFFILIDGTSFLIVKLL
jgi:peptidoglycan/LPS O-acetylase OafA/YrhL